MDAGLYLVQTCCVVLAWIAAEDGGARQRLEELLREQDQSMQDLTSVLRDQLKSVVSGDSGTSGDEDTEGKAVLEALIHAVA